jgi:hypothetical protein
MALEQGQNHRYPAFQPIYFNPANPDLPCIWWLLVPERVPSAVKNILLHIHPEGNKKVDDHRAAEGEKGEINKIQADTRGGDIEFFAQVSAYAKNVELNEIAKTIHKGLVWQWKIRH